MIMWVDMLILLVGRVRSAVATSATFLNGAANHIAAVTFFGLACRLAFQER
jgi:threonine/homoserine/homoserine lactone efflux protein